MKLTIVIPCYNEQDRLPKTLQKIDTFLQKEKKIVGTIFVVDDGSTDNIETVVKKAKLKTPITYVRHKVNKGKGAAVIRGIRKTTTQWIRFSDADLSTPIEELKTFIPHTKRQDCIIASRNLPKSKIPIKQSALRSFLGKGFAKLVPFLLGLEVHDTQCGFKLFRTIKAKKIVKHMQTRGWAFDAEMLFLAKKYKMRVLELPVSWYNSDKSKVNPITAPAQMLVDVIKVRYRWWNGSYEKD